MKNTVRTLCLVSAACVASSRGADQGATSPKADHAPTTLYSFTMRDIDGGESDLSSYKGKVVLVVNVASKCGFTGQYEGLEKLYRTYREQGLVILGFPSNDFLGQEPGTDEEIKQFCTLKYGVTFPMFAKITVKGKAIHPLYAYLTSPATNPDHSGAISWNFNKFLVGRDGTILARFGSRTKPDDKELVAAIEAALATHLRTTWTRWTHGIVARNHEVT